MRKTTIAVACLVLMVGVGPFGTGLADPEGQVHVGDGGGSAGSGACVSPLGRQVDFDGDGEAEYFHVFRNGAWLLLIDDCDGDGDTDLVHVSTTFDNYDAGCADITNSAPNLPPLVVDATERFGEPECVVASASFLGSVDVDWMGGDGDPDVVLVQHDVLLLGANDVADPLDFDVVVNHPTTAPPVDLDADGDNDVFYA